MSYDRTPHDIVLPQPADAPSDGFVAGCQRAQDLLNRMHEGTAQPDDLFRTVIQAVHAPDEALGLCNAVQEVLNELGVDFAKATVEAEVAKQHLAAALTVVVALTKKLEEFDANRLALFDEAKAVLEDVKAAVPRKLLKVERAVEFVYDADGQITGAAVVLSDGKPQPSA